MKLSIVIPCFNEKENIPLILERFSEVIDKKNIEVILVDNGSTDGSADVIQKLVPGYSFVKTIRIDVNKGYGYGILQGLKVSEGDFVGWTHADMQTDPADIIKAWRVIRKKENTLVYVKGLRNNRPLFDKLFTAGMSIFESIYFRQWLFDINAQPNVFPRAFYESWKNSPWDFSLDLYSLYQARVQGLEIIRIKVAFPQRIHGHSSWDTGIKAKWRFIKRTLEFSYKLKHPVKR